MDKVISHKLCTEHSRLVFTKVIESTVFSDLVVKDLFLIQNRIFLLNFQSKHGKVLNELNACCWITHTRVGKLLKTLFYFLFSDLSTTCFTLSY